MTKRLGWIQARCYQNPGTSVNTCVAAAFSVLLSVTILRNSWTDPPKNEKTYTPTSEETNTINASRITILRGFICLSKYFISMNFKIENRTVAIIAGIRNCSILFVAIV